MYCPTTSITRPLSPGVFTVYEAASAFLDSDSLTQVSDLDDNFYDQTCVRVVVFNEDAKVRKRVCQRAGVPELHLHDLRRTAIRWAIRAGVSQTVAMKISGHRSDSIFRRYDITDVKDIDDASEKLMKARRGGDWEKD